jgi:hypothetical protein
LGECRGAARVPDGQTTDGIKQSHGNERKSSETFPASCRRMNQLHSDPSSLEKAINGVEAEKADVAEKISRANPSGQQTGSNWAFPESCIE